ncbi:MAG TPA: YtxH domain-containing protein [Myxococcaceae bacterium]|nr:YtxH domain-containing protein [Myxococcaceae bacterium]
MWSTLKGLDRDEMLNWIGLQTRRTAADALLPTLGIFSIGLLVGAGLGLLLAPKSGQELREDLRNRLQGGENAQALPSSLAAGGVERTPRAV